jgi:hypothetical protein
MSVLLGAWDGISKCFSMSTTPKSGHLILLSRLIQAPLREVVWVIWPIFEELSFVVVVAVGMWATRLRCPSCPQRCRRRHLLDQRNTAHRLAPQLRRG